MIILGGETSVLPAFGMLGIKNEFFAGNQKLFDLGLKGVEVSFGADEYDGSLWIGNLTKAKIKKVYDLLSQFTDVSIHAAFGSGFSLLGSHPEMRKITLKEYMMTLELAPQIGAKAVTFHDGAIGPNVSKEQVEELLKGAMQKMDEKAGKCKVRVCWETGCGAFFNPPERFDRIRRLGLKNTGICMDTGHLIMGWKALPSKLNTHAKFIERYKDLIWHVHINDWQDKPKGKHKWNDHHAAGDGSIDWKSVFGSLVKIGYDGSMTMEYHPDGIPDEAYYLRNCEYIRALVRKEGGQII